jgi:hypothetical protein
MKKLYSGVIALSLMGASISCSDDFLSQPPVGQYDVNTANSAAGVKGLLIGTYSLVNGSSGMTTDPMQGLFGSIRGGEAHKGSVTGDQPQMIEVQRYEMTSGNSSDASFFQWQYSGIYRANSVLQSLAATTTGLTDAERKQITAEARFLRAHFHFMLKRLYKNIPYIDESATDVRVSNADESGNYIDAWPKILADFDFAQTNLAVTNSDWGRPNTWAAKAYYAKTLLYMANEGIDAAANYGKALTEFNAVITSGKTNSGAAYNLYANYHQNFDAKLENGSEWVWGAQNSILDGSSSTGVNGNAFIQYTGAQVNTGPGGCTCYGFFTPSQWFVNHFRVDAAGLPILDDATRNNSTNAIKSNEGVPNATAFTPDAGLIDPRLDWSVGRRGLPYLDFGDFVPSWVRAPEASSVYFSQKQFNRKSENGVLQGGSFNAMNAAVIRFADVILMAAELEARVGSLANATTLVNRIRTRMATNTTNKENWVMKADGVTPAANYKIAIYPATFADKATALKAILMERALELGLEGHSGYDLVRFGSAEITTGIDVTKFNAYIAYEGSIKGYLAGGSYTRIPDALAPIPQQAISNSFKDGAPTLKQNPGY